MCFLPSRRDVRLAPPPAQVKQVVVKLASQLACHHHSLLKTDRYCHHRPPPQLTSATNDRSCSTPRSRSHHEEEARCQFRPAPHTCPQALVGCSTRCQNHSTSARGLGGASTISGAHGQCNRPPHPFSPLIGQPCKLYKAIRYR